MLPVTPVPAGHASKIDPALIHTLNFKQRSIVIELLAALEADQLEIPVLPDMAIKVRELLDDPDCSHSQLVKLLSSDLAIYFPMMSNSRLTISPDRFEPRFVVFKVWGII